MLADCLTKNNDKISQNLIDCIDTGRLPNADKHPCFREMLKTKHKAHFATLCDWMWNTLKQPQFITAFLQVPMRLNETYRATADSYKASDTLAWLMPSAGCFSIMD